MWSPTLHPAGVVGDVGRRRSGMALANSPAASSWHGRRCDDVVDAVLINPRNCGLTRTAGRVSRQVDVSDAPAVGVGPRSAPVLFSWPRCSAAILGSPHDAGGTRSLLSPARSWRRAGEAFWASWAGTRGAGARGLVVVIDGRCAAVAAGVEKDPQRCRPRSDAAAGAHQLLQRVAGAVEARRVRNRRTTARVRRCPTPPTRPASPRPAAATMVSNRVCRRPVTLIPSRGGRDRTRRGASSG